MDRGCLSRRWFGWRVLYWRRRPLLMCAAVNWVNSNYVTMGLIDTLMAGPKLSSTPPVPHYRGPGGEPIGVQ